MTALAEPSSISGTDAEMPPRSWLLRPVMRSRNQPAQRKPPELLPLGASDSPACEPVKEN
jgi:hypothetical protein